MRFQDLGLLPELVTNTGYTEATPVQAEAIPHVLEGRDVLAGAQTGTGKTAAFALPMLQRLMASKTLDTPRALILAPTRELAAQVAASVQTYSKGMGIRHTVIFGGVGFFPQVKAVRRGVDVIIAPSISRRSKSSCWTRPIGCSTWALFTIFAALLICVERTARA